MRNDLIERLRRKADSTVESPAPHLTGDMKFYVYDAETRELLSEAAAALEAAREDAWQPIGTAPKDGSMYLCWVDAIRYGERDDGSMDSADVSEVDFGQWQSCSMAEEGGYHQNMMGSIGDGQIITHWRPLPDPPRMGSEGGQGAEGGS